MVAVPEGYRPMLGWALDLPGQLRIGLRAARAAGLKPGRFANVVVCGMGGSGISGSIARSLLWDRARQPMLSCRDYDLPAAAGRDTLLVAISYSGETEETLSAVSQARRRGCRVVAITSGGRLAAIAREAGWPSVGVPGGLPPRAALGYLLGACLGVLEGCGIARGLGSEILAAARLLEGQSADVHRQARALARAAAGSLPVVYSAVRSLDAVAERWRCQFNENAKSLCHTHELPELDHNEIVGLGGPGWLAKRTLIVVFVDREVNLRSLARVRETLDIACGSFGRAMVLLPVGTRRLERMLWLVLMGDLASIEMARLEGVDPRTIVRIDELKKRLSRIGSRPGTATRKR